MGLMCDVSSPTACGALLRLDGRGARPHVTFAGDWLVVALGGYLGGGGYFLVFVLQLVQFVVDAVLG